MSSKVGNLNISVKNNHMIVRSSWSDRTKLDFTYSDLPENEYDRLQFMINWLMKLPMSHGTPETKAFKEEDLPFVTRFAESLIKEMEKENK